VTARAAFTQAQVRRAIAAARKEGFEPCGIRSDGTVLIKRLEDRVASSVMPEQDGSSSDWEDFKA
jgi:hypothetical protein